MEIAGILVAVVTAFAALAVALFAHAKTRRVGRFLTHERRERRRVRVVLTGQRTAFERGLVLLEFTVPDGLSTLRQPNVNSTDTLAVAESRAGR